MMETSTKTQSATNSATVMVANYDMVFTYDLSALLLVPKDSNQEPYRFPLDSWEEGLQILLSANHDELSVSAPATLSGDFYQEFMPVHEQVTTITFNPTTNLIWAGGIGIIDIVATDPLGIVALEIPLSGVVAIPNTEPSIQGSVSGLVLRKGTLAPISASVLGTNDTVAICANPTPIIAFDVYYTPA